MKRKRGAEHTQHREEVLISSDSDDEEQVETSEEDWDEEYEDEDDDDDDDDDDSDADECDDDDDDDDDSDADVCDDDDEDDFEGNLSDTDYAHSSESEGVPYSKAMKKTSAGFYGSRDAESAQQVKRKTRHQQKLKKGSGQAVRGTNSRGEDRKLFTDALNIIRRGNLEKLNLEHCKAYLRHYSLRLTGSKTVLFDRVQEHIELKACGGMAKYPRSTFTMNCTGDACTGDIVLFKQKVYKNYNKACKSSTLPPIGKRVVAGRIVKESYGSDKQQHTFTVEVLWSKGPKPLPLFYPLLIKGRNLYRLQTFRQRWANEEERKRVLQEKHSRGTLARNARDDRVFGKKHSGPNQRRLPDSRAGVTVKRERKIMAKNFQVDTAPNKTIYSRGKGLSDVTSKETAFGERSMNTTVVSSSKEDENAYCERFRTTKRILDMEACFAGILIGAQGRHIGGIERASGAKLEIRENPFHPTLRLVEIMGLPEQVHLATGMVVQSFLDKGLPPPVVTKQSGGFTGPGWQAQAPYNLLSIPRHNHHVTRRRFF